ncbi:transcriptional regulator, TetR family [Enhydrobacter aerosaccus]|uniref:Transcriptional regulator, TetR family n=1 Tax=Enhydrobacter aerosaccus TaxID=225324 RepID=A0A1T4MR27_9HYPH|nr:TetR family transcriptional regulator [Enhydrobacter aerosaccus]SJZ69570.1 transcriptional regulator, TetR family [Enhydrobacter aerosaccus]
MSKPKSRRGDLTRDQIVTAALACLDRSGLEAFSLREVARELGVFPTALYWHVPGGRNVLLAEIAARVLDGVTPSCSPDVSWDDWLLDLFERYRVAVRAHPNAAPLLGARLVSNSGVQAEMVDGILWALERAGYEGAAIVDAYNAVVAGMVGFVTIELAPAPDEDTAAWQAMQRDRVAGIDKESHPALVRHAELLGRDAFILRWEDGRARPMDRSYRAFAAYLIAGLKAGHATPPPHSPSAKKGTARGKASSSASSGR